MLLRLPEVARPAAGEHLKVLFVCHYNRHRSATAERVFCKRTDLDVRSAGTSPDALVRVNGLMLDWADVVFVMEPDQREWIEATFPGHAALARIVCLDIPDEFTFLDPRLVALLTARVSPHVARLQQAR